MDINRDPVPKLIKASGTSCGSGYSRKFQGNEPIERAGELERIELYIFSRTQEESRLGYAFGSNKDDAIFRHRGC